MLNKPPPNPALHFSVLAAGLAASVTNALPPTPPPPPLGTPLNSQGEQSHLCQPVYCQQVMTPAAQHISTKSLRLSIRDDPVHKQRPFTRPM